MRKINLALIGFGSVGQEFSRILLDKKNEWAENYLCDFSIGAIATRSRGSLVNEKGINLERALKEIETDGQFSATNPDYSNMNSLDLTRLTFIDVLVELSTLNIKNGQPAKDHIASALRNGKHVITTNKGPVAFYYRELKNLAAENDRYFLFEGTVIDGMPVFNLARETLPGCKIFGFKGILNSTTNYLLSEMAKGETFEEALQSAQELGFVEENPAMDIDGWDAAAKTAVLLNVLMDANVNPNLIEREGIGNITRDDIIKARDEGSAIKLLCEGYIKDGKPYGRVAPQAIPLTERLAQIEGTSSLLAFDTEFLGKLTLEIEEPLITQTAYAVVSDLLTIIKRIF